MELVEVSPELPGVINTLLVERTIECEGYGKTSRPKLFSSPRA